VRSRYFVNNSMRESKSVIFPLKVDVVLSNLPI